MLFAETQSIRNVLENLGDREEGFVKRNEARCIWREHDTPQNTYTPKFQKWK